MPIQAPGKRYGKRLQHSKVFGHGAHGKKNGYADLLITPLVDMFVIIVLFLIANFSATGEVLMMTKDIELPEAQHVQEVESHPVVMVSGESIIVDGKGVARVEDLGKEEYLNIPALEEQLRKMKEEFVNLHTVAQDGQTFTGHVNIQAHKGVEFGIIKRVMFSCATAGYSNINFAVLSGGDKGAVASAATP